MTQSIQLRLGDCMAVMKAMPQESVEAFVCDPPYGLEFMGSNWDAPWKYSITKHGFSDGGDRVPAPNFTSSRNPTCQGCGKRKRTWKDGPPACACKSPQFDDVSHRVQDMQKFQDWSHLWLLEAYRVLKPGGVIKAFGGTRVFHRLAAAMVDAGFQDVSLEAWGYATGFPKSKNISLFLDKSAGAVGNRGRAIPTASTHLPGKGKYGLEGQAEKLTSNPVGDYKPVTDEAKSWQGWGTALKPAWEPVIIGRKPS